MADRLELMFGALADPLSKQLRGHRMPKAIVENYQRDADAITRLGVRRMLTDSEKARARQRLINRIAKDVYFEKLS